MKTAALLIGVALLAGCSTLNEYGIGGEPLIYCRQGAAVLDDRIAGPDSARLSFVRRLKDGDALCKPQSATPAPTIAPASEYYPWRFRMRKV